MQNKKLVEVLEKVKSDKSDSPEDKEKFLKILKESSVFIPAVLPPGTSPEVVRKILGGQGKRMAIPENANPQPLILENPQKERFLAVFTSDGEIRNTMPVPQSSKYPLTLNMNFDACMNLMQQDPTIAGIVINPYTHNILFQMHGDAEKPREIKVTLEQFHALTRQKMEFFYLPNNLFERKGELVEKLVEGKGEYFKAFYEELYETEVACPYIPEDFDFMALNISDDLLLVQITMPSHHRAPDTCPSVLFAWDRKEDKIWYYAIVRTKAGKKIRQVEEGGKISELGDAPSEGGELSAVLSLVQEG